MERLFVLDGIGQFRAVDAQELDVGPRDVGGRIVPQDQEGTVVGLALREEAQGLELIFRGALVLVQHLRGDGIGEVFPLKVVEVQVRQTCAHRRTVVEGPIPAPAPLRKASFLLRRGPMVGCTHPHPDLALVANRRLGVRPDLDHDDRAAFQVAVIDLYVWQGQDVAAVSPVGQFLLGFIQALQPGTTTVVLQPHQDHAGIPIPCQVVGEGADRPANGRALGGGGLKLHALVFAPLLEGQQILVREHGNHSPWRKTQSQP